MKNKNNMSPSMRREWIEMPTTGNVVKVSESPSMRREWIEMELWKNVPKIWQVSLHAEGVD